MKRIFDIIFSFVGIFFTWWIILIAVIISSIETRSFGLFIQKRVGKEGKLFSVFKIKTMKELKNIDTTITTSNDMRITKNGKFFRNTKIDELPQLFNVLFGSMSFVGPRPDVEGYADKLEGDDRIILTVRPGITGPASIKYKNEEEILARVDNPQEYNDEVIWKDKVKINKQYIKNWSLKKDIEYILKTLGQKDIWIEFFFHSASKKRIISFLFFDVLISLLTIILSYLLRFNFLIEPSFYASIVTFMLLLIPIKIVVFLLFKVYHVAWEFFGLTEYKQIILAHFVSYGFFTFIYLIFRNDTIPFPLSVIIIDMFLSLFFISLFRISKRLYLEKNNIIHKEKLLIVGTNSKSVDIIKSALRGEIDYSPIALVSNNENIVGTYFSNIPVYSKDSIQKIIEELKIDSVIVAEQLTQEELDELFIICNKMGIHDIKVVHILQDKQTVLSDVSIEDLFAYKPKDLDMASITSFIADKIVMITGAGGSIGSELSRQVAEFGAKQIILLDHSESSLYTISEELKGMKISSVMLSVKDKNLLDNVFKEYRPDIVIHAATYNHVFLCEKNIESTIENNIFGTKNMIDLSIQYEVKNFIFISTNEAAKPMNVMGATKRVCELYAHTVPFNKTAIAVIRFGNILEGSGSIIPKFKAQIKKGQNIVVTHPDSTCYFMMLPKVCQLVLQAASISRGRDLFHLDMGKPIKIVDLAQKMIDLSGRDDIQIEFIESHPGEKVFEELLPFESKQKTKYSSIFITNVTSYESTQLSHDIDVLLTVKDKVGALQKIVPEFTREDAL